MRQPIRVLDFNFNLLCEIEDYQNLMMSRKYTTYGSFEIKINKNSNGAKFLKKGNVVYLKGNKVGLIKHRELSTGDSRDDEVLLVKGYTLECILTQRITDVPSGQSNWKFTGIAETGIKSMIDYNACSGANKPERVISELLLAKDLKRGSNVEMSTRYGKLDEEVEKFLEEVGMGILLSLDYKLKKVVIDLYEGKDRTSKQKVVPPVIFSLDFGNVKSQKLTDSMLNYKTNAIVGGQGEGVSRKIVEVSRDAAAFSGLNRHEFFVDARDISADGNEVLTKRGNEKLNENKEVLTVEGTIIPTNTFVFEKDYFLGDIVTLKVKDIDEYVILDSRITQVDEVWDESGYEVRVIFGDKVPNLIDKIKKTVDSGSKYKA